MKKLLVVMLVMAMASAANAALLISVNGVVDPCDTAIILGASDYVTIDVYSDGNTIAMYDVAMTISGPGSLDLTNGWNYQLPGGVDDGLGWAETGMVWLDLFLLPVQGVTPPIMEGTVIDGIVLHGESIGDIVLTLTTFDGEPIFDTQIIHRAAIPEPTTLLLLGLGGLVLLRKRRT